MSTRTSAKAKASPITSAATSVPLPPICRGEGLTWPNLGGGPALTLRLYRRRPRYLKCSSDFWLLDSGFTVGRTATLLAIRGGISSELQPHAFGAALDPRGGGAGVDAALPAGAAPGAAGGRVDPSGNPGVLGGGGGGGRG